MLTDVITEYIKDQVSKGEISSAIIPRLMMELRSLSVDKAQTTSTDYGYLFFFFLHRLPGWTRDFESTHWSHLDILVRCFVRSDHDLDNGDVLGMRGTKLWLAVTTHPSESTREESLRTVITWDLDQMTRSTPTVRDMRKRFRDEWDRCAFLSLHQQGDCCY